jgi:hypothetical protein
MEQSESIGKLAEALSKAQSVWEAIRQPLTDNALAVIQTTEPCEEGVTVITTIAHSSGEWMRGRLSLYPKVNDPQGIGSAISYGRRYALAAISGVAQIDDDAESAMNREGVAQKPKNPEALPGTVDKVAVKDGEVWVQVDGKTLLSTTEPNMSRLLDAEGKKFEFLVTDSGRKAKGKPIYVIHSIFAIPEGANA